MTWPWNRTERRESSYTDLLVGLAVARAGGTTGASVGATGALQACSGAISRAFAAAEVLGPPHLTAGVNPAALSMIGRALMRAGEIVMVVEVGQDGDVRLLPASNWTVTGDVAEATWSYLVTIPGPSVTRTRAVPSEGLIHARFETDPAHPWRGVGPLQSASLAGRLSAEAAASLSDQESGPRGALLPLPVGGDDPTLVALKADLRTLSGKLATVESVRSLHPGAVGNAPSGDWKPERIGADPPRAEVELLTRAGLEVAAACGCSGLFNASTDTAARESYRRWLHGTVAPLGRLVSAELSTKMEADISLNFDSLMAADVQGRARAWRALAGKDAAMSPEVAARLVGLEAAE